MFQFYVYGVTNERKSPKSIAGKLHLYRWIVQEHKAIFAKHRDDTATIRLNMKEFGILERDAESIYWVKSRYIRKKHHESQDEII